jgi:uncharacterized protein YbbK (DUF523 family)
MQFVLISACLLGDSVRYNGGHKRNDHPVIRRWLREGRIVSVCPEVAGGLPVPRAPAEILNGADGLRVFAGHAKVIDARGMDVSLHFVRGAEHALECARSRNIRVAILKEGSPSCGSRYVYDGSFTATKIPGAGVTAALLRRAGITVFSEAELDHAYNLLMELEAAK